MSALTDLITTPIYTTTLPSTGEKLKFRPFVSKEERALLMAQESESVDTMLNTLSHVVRACMVGKQPEKFSTFDIEWLFVQIRMKSVDENSVLIFTCNKCEEKTAINVPLNTVYVNTPEGHSKTIKLDDALGVELQYPSIEDLVVTNDRISHLASTLKKVYKGDIVLDAEEFTNDEVKEFLDNLTKPQFNKIANFYDTIPEVRLDLKWKCPKCGNDHNQTLKGLNSFF